MSVRRSLILATTSLAAFGMVVQPRPARAQDNAYNATVSADPPALVGRLAVSEGSVSARASGQDNWTQALLNAPASNGDSYWTEQGALAGLQIGPNDLWLSGATEFDIATLDDGGLKATTPQGEAYLDLTSLPAGTTYTLETPRGTVSIATQGQYGIVAGDTANPTVITVLAGEAHVTGPGIQLDVQAGQSGTLAGSDSFSGTIGTAQADDFVLAMQKRDATTIAANAPAAVGQMTGCQDLARHGSWKTSSQYGAVWYPTVDSGWVPYRDGRWVYDAPWGWTWVDDENWGFAPFHYGRWVQVDDQWAWAPAYDGYAVRERPVYAPALVAFFGIGLAAGVALDAAFSPNDRVGWVPLGPKEAYYPAYRTSRSYINRVNVLNVRNVSFDNGRGAGGMDRFSNARFATVVPGNAFANSSKVRGEMVKPDKDAFAKARFADGRPPVAPTGRTIGVTKTVAEKYSITKVEERHAEGPKPAPGAGHGGLPTLRQGKDHPGVPAAGRAPGALPPLRAPGEAGPSANRESHAPVAQPERGPGGLPGLRAPGALPPSHVAPVGREPVVRAPEPGRLPEARGPQPRVTPQHTPEPLAAREPAARPERVAPPRPVAPRPLVRPPAERSEPARVPAPHVARPAAPRPVPRAEPRPVAPRAEPRPVMQRPEPRPAAPHPAAPRPAPHPQPGQHPDKPPQR